MSLAKVDHWIGKHIFEPPIIKLCQVTRQTQFAVARLFWFIAALDGFYRADSLLGSIIFGVLSVVMMITASLRADMPTHSSLPFRMLALALLAMDVVTGVALAKWAGVEFWLFALVAEYAGTIRTIPPRETKKRKAVPSAQPSR
ncbi:MAG TPA: hypothetical protein VGB48_07840 [Allosphingosinicella sp.]|jgi:hypothetical protein